MSNIKCCAENPQVAESNLRVYGIRLDAETAALLKQVAKSRGTNMADLIRQMVRTELARLSYLSEEDKKALGVEVR